MTIQAKISQQKIKKTHDENSTNDENSTDDENAINNQASKSAEDQKKPSEKQKETIDEKTGDDQKFNVMQLKGLLNEEANKSMPKDKISQEVDKYTCKECGKKFNCAACVKRHEVTHTGAKPFL